MRSVFIGISIVLILVAGFFVSQYPPRYLIFGTLGAVVFLAVFIRTEVGLYILIFAMLLSPEFMVGHTGAGSLGRGVTLRLEDFLLPVIGLSWFAKNAIFKEIGMVLKTPLNRPIFYYIVACVVATGFGIMSGRVQLKTGSLYVLKYIEYFIVFFMVVNHARDEKQMRRLVFCLLLTCFIVSIVGMLQIPGGQRVSAPFEGKTGEPNTFGGYLVFMLAIAAGLFYHIKDARTRQLLIALIVVIIPPFMYTESRSSFLAFIPMAIVLCLMMRKRAIILGVMAALFILSPLILPTTVTNRILYTIDQPQESGQIQIGNLRLDTSTSARLASWREAFTSWPKHPVFGFGVTGFSFVDAQFPRVLVETGAVGLLAFIFLLYAIFKMAVTHYQQVQTPFAKGLCMGYIAGFIALLVHCVGANTFIIVRIMEPFWFFTGIVYVLPMLEMQEEVDAGAPAARPVHRKYERYFEAP